MRFETLSRVSELGGLGTTGNRALGGSHRTVAVIMDDPLGSVQQAHPNGCHRPDTLRCCLNAF